ncbi:MAG: DUF1080 domain-containing protein [FCB group bacterium]|nr:DUF1080 domain-containing protein [FCB group bacterium]
MRSIRRTGVVALLALTLLAGPATAQAVDEGSWIDLFDGETLFGWTVFGDAPWAAQDGALVCNSGSGGWIATTSRFADFELTAKVKLSPEASTGVAFRAALEGHPSENGSGVITIVQPKEGGPEWHDVSVIAKGDAITATLDGQPVAVKAGRKVGYIGFQYHHNNDAQVAVKDVKLRPIALTSIFNGKDLSGWNIIPDRKSEFSVKDGAMNIVNGNGQIETAGTYKDFVLQLDIQANGTLEKPLNSGVFFRGPVGVFWKGYESQVRNEFTDGDRTKPKDYGTGGNYGNQDARKVVPTEGEWFTKTIVVDGGHAAVWVNGYQVSDFTDTRPVSDNADGKSGYVPGPGTIHLQGHDPTTNMFFKNINIQPYDGK